MKHLNYFHLTLLLICGISFSGSAQLLTETFETDGEGTRYTSNTFLNACHDFFTRMDNTPATYCLTTHPTNPDGSFYWGGEDTDAAAGGEGVLTLNPLTVTGLALNVDVLLAVGRPNDFRLEPSDYFIMEYNMDGAGWNIFGAFYGNNNGTGGGNLQEDTNLDGSVNAGATEIATSDFTNVNFTIPATGNSVQVRVRLLANTGTEEIIFDNIRINGTVACTAPTTPTVLASPDAICVGGSTTLNITGTLNSATHWAIYSGNCGVTPVGTTASSTFVVSPTSNTTYYVRGEGGCVVPSTSCGADGVTVNVADNASYTYAASAFCANATDPMPNIAGLPGGTFSSTAGLSINASTGVIDVSASTPGTYTVTYTTNGPCPSTSTQSVTVNSLDNASFNYGAASYCADATDPSPSIGGLPGGTFSSGGGLGINASTGAIDVSISTPGTYTVTYTTAGICPNTSSVSVTINALDDASFNYSAASFCANDSDPTPTITGVGAGTFSSGAGLSINASTGVIDVSASAPGTYTVTYTTSGPCPNSSSVTVTVNALDDASFNYGAASYCADATDPSPSIGGLPGGTFSSGGLGINAATGAIDVSISTPGTYTVTYTTAGICPNTSSVSVTINALDDASFNYSAASYCANDSDPTPTITGVGAGTFSSGAGLSINASTGVIDVSASAPGTYTVTYTTSGPCPNSSSVTVTVNALDDASFNYGAASYCADATDPSPSIGGLPGGTFSSGGGLGINASTGAIDVSISTPGTYTVTYTTAGSCPNTSSVSVTINALDDASFNYSAASYCANDLDPTPTITGVGAGTFSSGAGLSINASTGVIDVSASAPGTYTVTYTTSGPCPNSSSVTVTVNSLDDASFSYAASSYCSAASDPSPASITTPGGAFSSTAGLSINAATGVIDLSASTPGSYNITYTTSGSCPNSSNVSVAVTALDDASFTYSAASYCSNETDPTPTITGVASGSFASGAGLSINASTGVVDLSASTPGTYTVTYTTIGACSNSSTQSITVNTIPTAPTTVTPITLCPGEDVILTATGSGTGNIVFYDNTMTQIGSTPMPPATATFNAGALADGTYMFSATEDNGGCESTPVAINVTVGDLTAPTVVCQDVTIFLDGSGSASIVASDIDGGSTDDCGAVTLSASQTTFDCTNIFGAPANNLVITAAYDAGLTGGTPKGVELFVLADIADLSNYGIGSANNGGGTDGEEFTFPAVAVTAGTYIYVASESTQFTNFFGFAPDYTDGSMGINGDDAVELFFGGSVIDVFGDINVDGSGQPWDYLDGWAYRNTGTGPDGSAFTLANWTFSGINVFDLQTSNATTPTPMPIGTYAYVAGPGPTPVTLTVTDASGNTGTCVANVTVSDSTAPTAVCQDVTIFLDGSGTASIVAGDVDNGSSDNCGIESIAVSPMDFTCADIGPNTVTLTVTDGSGNTSTCTSTVTVSDSTAPTASCQDVTIFLDGSGTASIVASDINNGSTDNCTTVTLAAMPTTFTCADIGTNAVTLTVTDGSGNTSTCTSTVTVSDSTAPVAVCQDITVFLDGSGTASIVAADLDGGSSDNCSTVTLAASPTTFTCGNVGANTVTLTVTDGSGNTSTCTSTVTVSDSIAPTASCQDITVFLDGSGTASILAADLDNGSSDNCSVVTLTASSTTFSCADIGANTVTLTVTDVSGNTSTCTSTVTVSDSIAPIASCQDITVFLDGSGTASIVAADLDAGSSDNCSTVTLAASPTTFTCADIGTNTVTLTVTDGSGNTSMCTSTVTISDTIVPVPDAASLADETAVCEVTSLTAPTATDNCSVTVTVTNDATFPITTQGTTVVTWTFDDGNGNTATQTQNVILNDVTAPVADVATLSDITDECEVTSLIDPTATDDCGGAVTVTNDATLPISAQGTTTITWTYTDENGNASTQTQNVVITDVTAPVADSTSLPDVIGNCEVISLTDPTATDNCSGTLIITNDAVFPISGLGTTTVVTWTYDDGNGNTSTQTQNVIIDDFSSPLPNSAPLPDVTGECSVDMVPTAPTANDACAGTVTGVMTSAVTFPVTTPGITVITWAFDDGNGNVTTQSQNIVIDDVSAPVPDVATLDNATGICSIDQPTAPTATDNCSGPVTATTSTVFPITAIGTTVIVWEYVDADGNISTQTQDAINSGVDATATVSTDGATITANEAGATYAWVNCDFNTTIAGETSQSFTPASNGNYAVIVSIGACSDTSACETISTVGIDKLSADLLTVYPNPSLDGYFTVSYEGTIEAIDVVDVLGRVIELPTDLSTGTVNGSELAAGRYMIRVRTEQSVGTIEIVIAR